MKKFSTILLLILLNAYSCTMAMALNQPIICHGKQVLGKAEKITLLEKNILLEAKLDTGATMASLSASDITIFKRDNKFWVAFTVFDNKKQTKTTFEKPLIRYIHILKRKEENQQTESNHEQFAERPVVSFLICLGNQKKQILVNLIDRTHFQYPMLLGSGALKKFDVLVDVNQEFVTLPLCVNTKS